MTNIKLVPNRFCSENWDIGAQEKSYAFANSFEKCLDTMYTVPGKITKYFHTDLESTVGKYFTYAN